MPNSASAIVTAAEPIWGHLPCSHKQEWVSSSESQPTPSSPEPGRGSGRRRRERHGQSAALQSARFRPSASARLRVRDARPLRTRFGSHRGRSPGSCIPHRSNVSDAAANLPALRGSRASRGSGEATKLRTDLRCALAAHSGEVGVALGMLVGLVEQVSVDHGRRRSSPLIGRSCLTPRAAAPVAMPS
jgi:hypothetical protein